MLCCYILYGIILFSYKKISLVCYSCEYGQHDIFFGAQTFFFHECKRGRCLVVPLIIISYMLLSNLFIIFQTYMNFELYIFIVLLTHFKDQPAADSF